MFRKVPQPPVNPAQRDLEHHDFWVGFVVALMAVILALYGARRLTSVDTVDGGQANETQLMKAFTAGGLQYASKQAPPPPPHLADPAAEAEALNRWARQQANTPPPTWKVRVDLAAKTPCPT